MLNTMVNAYSDRDGQLVKSMLNSAFIKHMDVEFAILAKSLAEKWTEEPVCYTIFVKCILVVKIKFIIQFIDSASDQYC